MIVCIPKGLRERRQLHSTEKVVNTTVFNANLKALTVTLKVGSMVVDETNHRYFALERWMLPCPGHIACPA